jgi:hypothetical protein
MNDHAAAAPGDVASAQRHQLARPQAGPDAEHHDRQRRGPFHRVTLGRRDRGQLGAFSRCGGGAGAPANGVARIPGPPCTGAASP